MIIGAFSLNYAVFDVYLTISFGVLGYIMRKMDYEPAPLILAFILTPMFEDNLRQALLISHGNFTVFLTRPLSFGFLVVGLGLLVMPLIARLHKWGSKGKAAA
jgi:TctA family transporter